MEIELFSGEQKSWEYRNKCSLNILEMSLLYFFEIKCNNRKMFCFVFILLMEHSS